MRPKAVFLDFDDTLVLTQKADKAGYLKTQELAKRVRAEVDTAQLINDFTTRFTAMPWDPANQVGVDEWRAGLWLQALQDQDQGSEPGGRELSQRLYNCFKGMRLRHMHLEPGVQDLIDWLNEEAIAIVVITNGHPDVQRGKLAASGIDKLIKHILVGGEETRQGRPEKPAASIFLRACSLAGCQPHEAWHVGDSLYSDIGGAIGAGLAAAVWVNPMGRAVNHQHPQPSHIIAHIAELQEILATELQAGL